MTQFQGKCRYTQTADAAKQELYKILTNTEEPRPEDVTLSKL